MLDPPRAGAEAQVRELAKSKVKTVVMVACDARTFARDAAILVAAGFAHERSGGGRPVHPVHPYRNCCHISALDHDLRVNATLIGSVRWPIVNSHQ